jgi:hypothetical protein
MFERFWSLYPRRLARKDAERAWNKIPVFKQIDVMTALRNHVRMWEQKGTEKQYIPYPASWLNGARWEDELEAVPEMPQCDWNRNGLREAGTGRCEAQAVKDQDGQFYCANHCAKLGLKVVRG